MLVRLNTEIKDAMRARNSFRVKTLKYIKSLLQNNSISEKSLKDIDVVMAHHKKMSKSLSLYQDKALEELKEELVIIEEFVPKTLSKEEIELLIDKHLPLKNMGLIMKAVKEEVEGPLDGKMVSALVKSKLS